MINKIKHLIVIVLFPSLLLSQFGEVQVSFDDRLLHGNERQILFSLESEIKRFYTTTIWDDEFDDLSIPLSIHIVFEGVASKGAVQTVLAQVLFTSDNSQRYYDSGVQFIYTDAVSIYFDPVIFDPLASFFSFYGFLILASDVDTYIPMGGNEHYETARNIAHRGNTSNYPRGWENRLELTDDISENFGLRKTKFSYFYAMDLVKSGEYDRAIVEFNNMINGLEEVYDRYPRERHTLHFLNNHSKLLAKTLGLLRLKEVLYDLIDFDMDNEEIYQRALDEISP